jgi:hypothetical protein
VGPIFLSLHLFGWYTRNFGLGFCDGSVFIMDTHCSQTSRYEQIFNPLWQRRSPERLGMFCAMKSKMVIGEMPTTGAALKSSDAENWMRAIQEVLKSLEQMETWDVEDRIEVARDAKGFEVSKPVTVCPQDKMEETVFADIR